MSDEFGNLDGVRITIDDVRRGNHCARGIKAWFEGHGIDFRDFLKNGISADRFLATGDGLAERVVRLKLEAGNEQV